MSKINLDNMSYKQLLELEQRVSIAITERKKAEKEAVRLKIREMASQSGFDMDELMGGGTRGAKKGTKVAPKYRNPKNASETWTGRGRQPRWLAAELKSGKKLSHFLIK